MFMSYCMFEGTYKELQRCLYEVDDHIGYGAEYSVSDDEIDYFKKMVEMFHDFMRENSIIDENGDLDPYALDSVCEDMRHGCEEDEEDEEEEEEEN